MEQPHRASASNVVGINARPILREPPITAAELAEYRRIRPQLLAMLAEWKALTAPEGCPIARQIVHGR